MTRATFDDPGVWGAAPFVHAPWPLLRAVLGDDDLRTDDEARVLAVVLRWLRHRGGCAAGARAQTGVLLGFNFEQRRWCSQL